MLSDEQAKELQAQVDKLVGRKIEVKKIDTDVQIIEVKKK